MIFYNEIKNCHKFYRRDELSFGNFSRHGKVGDLAVELSVARDMFGRQVAMDEALLDQILHSRAHLTHHSNQLSSREFISMELKYNIINTIIFAPFNFAILHKVFNNFWFIFLNEFFSKN